MRRKKPLDIGVPVPERKSWTDGKDHWAALAALLVIAFTIASSYFLFFAEKAQGNEEGSIELFVQDSGVNRHITAYSSCGNFSLFLDGREVAHGEAFAEYSAGVLPGAHLAEAKNAACSASLQFVMHSAECNDGETQSCNQGNCSGTKTCLRGRWATCELPKKVCVPGQKAGCSTNACSFGYTTCNECGSGFGHCLPPEGGVSSCQENCTASP